MFVFYGRTDMKLDMKRIVSIIAFAVFIASLFSITASADTGPKPSVRVSFENMGDELCYGTLLSKGSTGPASVWNGEERSAYHKQNENFKDEALLDYDTWKAFVEYEDSDGYYFLQEKVWEVSKTKKISWGYYPPQSFKILLYYPESQKFVVSGIYERYAFDTYYSVDMNGIDIAAVEYDENNSNDERIEAHRAYQWRQEVISLVARIIITIAVEMGIALLFGFRGKKTLLFLAVANISTQIILNLLLNFVNFRLGPFGFVFYYALLEVAVIALEAVAYSLLMNKLTEKKRRAFFYVIYAFAANLISFAAGFAVANILPGIF